MKTTKLNPRTPIVAFKLFCLVILHSTLFVACGVEPPTPKDASTTSVGIPIINNQVKTANHLKVVLFADHSGSIDAAGIPMLERRHIAPLLQLVKTSGGEIVLGKIGYNSKSHLARYSHINQLPFPQKKAGENSKKYQKRILRHQQKVSEIKNGNSGNNLYSIEEFDRKAVPIYDYSNIEGASDIASAVELAKLVMLEESVALSNPKKYIIIISDGMDFRSHSQFPSSLPDDVKLIVVNTSLKSGNLERYKHLKMTSIENAVRYILDQ